MNEGVRQAFTRYWAARLQVRKLFPEMSDESLSQIAKAFESDATVPPKKPPVPPKKAAPSKGPQAARVDGASFASVVATVVADRTMTVDEVTRAVKKATGKPTSREYINNILSRNFERVRRGVYRARGASHAAG